MDRGTFPQHSKVRLNQKGVSMIEALLGIGLLAVLVGTNLSMISSFFKLREEQIQKHEFYQSLKALSVQLSDKSICNAVMKSLGPPSYMVKDLKTAANLDEIGLPSQPPLIKKDAFIFDGTTKIEKIQLQLVGKVPEDPNSPNTYLWLTFDYHFIAPGKSAIKTELKGTKSLLYEVMLNPSSPTGSPVAGSFESCSDYITKRNRQSSQTMCLMLGSTFHDGKCDLMDNMQIRATACQMLGRPLLGRYCGP